MEHLGVVDEEELERVCSERETVLDRPLHHWEREALHLHLRNESLKAVSREERLHIPGFDKVICSSFGSHLLDLLIVKEITALRNSEILEGSFIVDQLGDGTPDSLGALGTTQCSSCGALKCCMIANMIL